MEKVMAAVGVGGGVTTEEGQLISMLRDKLKDVLDSDYFKSDAFLIHWVRAQSGNLDKAEKLIRASLNWRKEKKVTEILSQPVNEFFTTNFPMNTDGVDKMGRPLITIPFGKWDLEKALGDNVRFEQFQNYCIQMHEKVETACRQKDAARKDGDPIINQFTAIYDWEGFSFKPLLNVTVATNLAKVIGMLDGNYPDTLGDCIFINCSNMITTFLGIIKPVMSAKTFGKIQWFSSGDKVKAQEAIMKLVNPNQLSTGFGGVKS